MKNGMIIFIYKNNRAMNSQHLKVIFNEAILINNGSHMIIDTDKYNKMEIGEKIYDFNASQFLFGCSKHETLMRQCLKYGLTIEHIRFWEEIESTDKEYLYELLRELKRTDISLNLKNLFFHELLGIVRDVEYTLFENNSISSIEFKTPNGNKLMFYENNLVSFEEEDIDLIKNIMSIFKE